MSKETTISAIYLNAWGGKLRDLLLDFFEEYKDVDVFCLQEMFNGAEKVRPDFADVTPDFFSRVGAILTKHEGLFCNEQDGEEGEAMFVRREFFTGVHGEKFVHRWRNAMDTGQRGDMLGRAVQYAQIQKGHDRFIISHLHGLWTGQGKSDTPERIAQSEKVQAFLHRMRGMTGDPQVFGGDLNLLPITESIRIIEESGMVNLTKQFGITNTRSELYKKDERYADYVFVSPEIEVVDFRILPNVVSDHLAQYLVFRQRTAVR